MSDLTNIEKLKFEKLFGMASGYVLDFSNWSFQDFVHGSVGVDIYEERYNYGSGSKANRLRSFWDAESDRRVAKLLSDLLEKWELDRDSDDLRAQPAEQALFQECQRIVERLKQTGPLEGADAIEGRSGDVGFSLLAESIRDSILRNEPEAAIDRLHTYVTKYARQLCDRHGISYDRDKPLHSLFGEYVKHLVQDKHIESDMTERILRSSISILQSFNDVRNNQSLAHDNPVLSYRESVLIYNHVSSVIRFVESIESETPEAPDQEAADAEWNDVFPE